MQFLSNCCTVTQIYKKYLYEENAMRYINYTKAKANKKKVYLNFGYISNAYVAVSEKINIDISCTILTIYSNTFFILLINCYTNNCKLLLLTQIYKIYLYKQMLCATLIIPKQRQLKHFLNLNFGYISNVYVAVTE